MSKAAIEQSIQRGWSRLICERGLKTGTREAMAVAIYELMQEHGLDHRDIMAYAGENATIIRQRAVNRRLA